MKQPFKPEFDSKEDFMAYLLCQVIPDLKKSGYEATAQDFEEAVYWLNK